jgi:hypothetical protein
MVNVGTEGMVVQVLGRPEVNLVIQQVETVVILIVVGRGSEDVILQKEVFLYDQGL